MIQGNVILPFQLHFLIDAPGLLKLLKLLQRPGVILLHIIVFAKKEECFAELLGLAVILYDAFQPKLRAMIILVLDLKICQHQQRAGMVFEILGIADKALQQRFRFLYLIDLPQHSCHVNIGFRHVFAVRITLNQALECVLGLKSGIALVIQGSRHQVQGVVRATALLVPGEDHAAFLDGFGIFIHGLRRGPPVGVQGSFLRGFKVLLRIVHGVVDPASCQDQ